MKFSNEKVSVICIALAVLFGCAFIESIFWPRLPWDWNAIPVIISNNSDLTLSHPFLKFTGGTNFLPSILPHQKVISMIRVTGESGLHFLFEAPERTVHECYMGLYLEQLRFGHVDVFVDRNLEIRFEDKTRVAPYFVP